jgi:hypothetical protein
MADARGKHTHGPGKMIKDLVNGAIRVDREIIIALMMALPMSHLRAARETA